MLGRWGLLGGGVRWGHAVQCSPVQCISVQSRWFAQQRHALDIVHLTFDVSTCVQNIKCTLCECLFYVAYKQRPEEVKQLLHMTLHQSKVCDVNKYTRPSNYCQPCYGYTLG